MLKICIIAPFEYPIPAIKGGALEQVVQSICEKNEKYKKLDITVLATNDKNLHSKYYSNTEFVYFDKSFIDRYWYILFRIIKKFFKVYIPSYPRMIKVKEWINHNKDDFDLFIYEDGLTYMIPYLFKGISRRKVISHLHWVGDPDKNTNKYFATLLPVSNFVGNVWKKKTEKQMSVRTITVKNGIDINSFNREISDEEKKKILCKLGIESDEFVVIYIGRIVPEKGVKELIDAINSINDLKIVLVIIGAAKFAEVSMTQYEKLIKEKIEKSAHKIVNLGFINNKELYKYQHIAHVAVMPTIIEEAAPLTCVENMAAGLPLIITNSGGMPEYTGRESSILVLKEKDIERQIADAIVNLKEDTGKRLKMKEKSLEVANEYTEDMMYKDFLNALENIYENNY